MPNHQSSLKQQQKLKINFKYILIVLILAVLITGGVLTYQYWWLSKYEIKPPELTITGSTVNWQTYRNERFGYEIKYPLNGNIIEVPLGLLRVPIEATVDVDIENVSIRINSWENSENYKTLEELIEGEKKKQKEGFFSVFPSIPDSYQKFQIDRQPAIKWSFYHKTIGKIGTITLVLKGNHFYDIEGKTIPERGDFLAEFTDTEEKIYDLFLSTFKFIK